MIGLMECGGRFVRREEMRDLLEERDRLGTDNDDFNRTLNYQTPVSWTA